jgi:hypothetical protein
MYAKFISPRFFSETKIFTSLKYPIFSLYCILSENKNLKIMTGMAKKNDMFHCCFSTFLLLLVLWLFSLTIYNQTLNTNKLA